MAEPNPTPPLKHRPRVSVRREGKFASDLDLLMGAHKDQSDAVRTAVSFLADIYRWAWDTELYPRNIAPTHMSVRLPDYQSKESNDQQV